ncbi:hypothetical protein [Bacillus sp. SRB1LM]|uniref:hypothetical protein n=1 Tax=Bacillus sp. SRB1LM TaxID=2608688 RepID=UPI0018C43045|nr:hypothetical protein [Bacillus sp. SRB1LM]MBG0964140.1 hypothetical protein [Bacillus sp. SRB1LM]MBG0967193.1 hypothetical protein [Bacillus sp. SRB1LM]
MPPKPKGPQTLSTGILRRHSNVVFITVDVMNADPNNDHSVSVQMFDWTSNLPVVLPLLTPSSQSALPNQAVFFFSNSLSPNVRVYEVRIVHPGDEDVVINVSGISGNPIFDPEEVDTVLQHDLVKLKLE